MAAKRMDRDALTSDLARRR